MADGLLWDLLAKAPDPGQAFGQGFQGGQNTAALNAYAQNPTSPESLAGLMRIDPQLGMRAQEFNDRRQDRAKQERLAELQQNREQVGVMGNLLNTVKDEATYQQARQAAQGLGMDLSEVPPSFDPGWVGQAKMQAQALAGRLDRELMAVAPGTAVIDKRTGAKVYENPDRPRYYPVPPGGRLELDPSYGGGDAPDASGIPQPDSGSDGYTATNPQTGETVRYNQQSGQWEPVGGASPSNGSGGFPRPS
jgi:hypothetical protein